MAGKEDPPMDKKKSEVDRDSTLQELRALREKRLSSTRKEEISKPSASATEEKTEDVDVDLADARDKSDDAIIAAVRASRMQAEAYHDIARLRKRAQHHQAKAANFMTKYKSFEAKAQKALTKAVRDREKAGKSREKEKELTTKLSELEKDLKATISGETEVSPETVKLRMAKVEKRIAKAQERARKFEAKAASQNEKAAMHKTKAAFYLEQSKINEAEVKNYSKRADNLEKAG